MGFRSWPLGFERAKRRDTATRAEPGEHDRCRDYGEGRECEGDIRQQQARRRLRAIDKAEGFSYDEARSVVDGYLRGAEKRVERIVFVVDLDIHCPASLAVFLISLTCLMDQSRQGDGFPSSVRVLGLGVSEVPQYLGRLFRPFVGDLVVSVPPKGNSWTWEKAKFEGTRPEELASSLWSDMSAVMERDKPGFMRDKAEADERGLALVKKMMHLVINFHCPPQHLVDLKIVLVAGVGKSRLRTRDPISMPVDTEGHKKPLLQEFLSTFTAGEVRVVTVDTPWRPRNSISGYSSVHLVIADRRRSLSFDVSTSQPAHCWEKLSRSEMLEILMGVERMEVAADRVFIYHCAGQPCGSLQDYLDRGTALTSLDTHNSQIQGFLVAASEYEGYSRGIEDTIGAFITDP